MLKCISLVLLSFFAIQARSQGLVIDIKKSHFQIDLKKNLILAHLDKPSDYKNTSCYNIVLSLDSMNYSFIQNQDSLSFTSSYNVRNVSTGINYKLYFTQLPIISIATNAIILDEPKHLANFVYADDEQIVASTIGIELRGGSSQSYPKKTYDLEFWKDQSGIEKRDVKFKNMRSDDDWILDGLYNEPLRIRSHLASKLWLQMHSPHYSNLEPTASSGGDVEYVELFLNGNYHGLYNLSEQVDRKLLQLKEPDLRVTVAGELYKGINHGVNLFTSLTNYDNQLAVWDGYEVKYPQEINSIGWDNLYGFTDFVMNSCQDDFMINVWKKFSYENYADYFIFLNLLRANDNTGKNIYTARYNANQPYFYVPWDLDGCFGTSWTGQNDHTTDDVLTNGFHDRVLELNPSNCNVKIAQKWFAYRDGILNNEVMKKAVQERHNYLLKEKLYEREHIAFPSFSYQTTNINYFTDWLDSRLLYLDSYFRELRQSTEAAATKDALILFPNPAKTTVCILNINHKIDKNYRIYSLCGQLIQKGSLDNGHISIANLCPATYIISLNNRSHQIVVAH